MVTPQVLNINGKMVIAYQNGTRIAFRERNEKGYKVSCYEDGKLVYWKAPVFLSNAITIAKRFINQNNNTK